MFDNAIMNAMMMLALENSIAQREAFENHD